MITQGKWEVGFKDRGMGCGDFAVLADSGDVIAKVTTTPDALDNANLIAAAPLLYEELKAVCQNCGDSGVCEQCGIGNAIAAAEGK